MFSFLAAARTVMRRHQHRPQHRGQLPMWRLIGGELLWAVRQLAAQPWTAVGLVGGGIATFSVLGAVAPGPVLAPPWRLVAAVAAGLVIAAGARELQRVRDRSADLSPTDHDDEGLPLVGAAIIGGAVVVVILVVWLAVWVGRSLVG